MTEKNIKLLLLVILFIYSVSSKAQVFDSPAKPIKNVIIMIPDGTSVPVISLARWYEHYLNGGNSRLAVDSILCGFVKTFSSNAPIGDSAPTSGCYATGQESQTGFIAMYPPVDTNDLVAVERGKAYQPLLTVLEAAKLSGKSTGLVFTCEFTHATPADFSAHYYKRNDYNILSKQIVYNNVDVVFGGGESIISNAGKTYLAANNWDTAFGNFSRFKNLKGKKAWALFGNKYMKYDIDRDTAKEPSLADMTVKAISLLSKNNDNGFFLMIEGSKVDWAAHSNDPVGMVTEFLAFDKAVNAALNFAKSNRETVVIVCPDHGNGGISIGNKLSQDFYDKISLPQLIEPLAKCKRTASGIAEIISAELKAAKTISQERKDSVVKTVFKTYCAIENLSAEETKSVSEASSTGSNAVAKIISARTYIGFTTSGHTGEDVFLGVYAPPGTESPTGLVTGRELNKYICSLMNIASLNDSTEKYFSPHKSVFKNCNENIIIKQGETVLTVSKGKNKLEIPAFGNTAYYNNKPVLLKSVVVFVDINNTFYLPVSLGKIINGE